VPGKKRRFSRDSLETTTSERLEAIVEAAEQAAAKVIDEAEAEARRHLEDAHAEADGAYA
jgi:cell division septum initiation protein DivIVA